MRGLSIIVIGVTTLAAGCSVSFKFGKPPQAPTTPWKLDQCVFQHSIRLRAAWSSAQREHNPDARVNRVRRSRAWTFYRGRRRISAEDALTLLRNKKLRHDYRDLWVATARRGRARVLGSSIGLAAAAVLGITGGVLLYGYPGPGEPLSTTGKAKAAVGFTLIGLAAVSAVVLPLVMRVGYRDVRAGESFRTLFISTASEPALRQAVARYNQRVKQACIERVRAAP